MKLHQNPLCFLLLAAVFTVACRSSHTMSRDKKQIVAMKSIAILPVEVVHLGRLHDVSKEAESQQLGIEREGYILQRDLYRYFLREMKRYELDRAYLQDLRVTNELLKELEDKSHDKIELSVREIADWLGVDGILTTSVDQLAPGNALAAGFMNGTLNTDQNITVLLSLRSKYGQIYWRHNDEKATTQESVYDVSKDLLRHASKTFFNVYPTVKQKKDKKPKKEKKKKEIQIRGRE